MIKKLHILPIIAMSLVACSKADYTSLKIITPIGAPAVALYGEVDNPNFETNGEASNIIASMATEQYDVVVLPTNAGFQAINKGVNYKIAATITFGNLFIAATGNDDDGVMDADDKIILFQQGNVPDKIFHYVYGDFFNSAISYVGQATDAAKCLATGKNIASENEPVDYVLMAEPSLTVTLANDKVPTYGKASVYANLQELFKEQSNGLEIFQASIFVKASADKESIKAFLKETKSNIESAIKNPDLLLEPLSKKDDPTSFFGVPSAQIAVNVLKKNNGMGLGFKYAKQNMGSIDLFLQLFNIGASSEENYF